MRKLNRKIVLFTIVTYYNWCENVICCFVLHTDRPKNFTLDLCCKALHRVHRPNNSSRAVFQRIPPPQSLIPFISFLYLLFFIVKQLDQGNRFTNWIRSLVEITRYSHTHTQIYSSKLVESFYWNFSTNSILELELPHSRRKAKRPSHFSRFEMLYFLPPFLKLSRVTSIEGANSFRCWPVERKLRYAYMHYANANASAIKVKFGSHGAWKSTKRGENLVSCDRFTIRDNRCSEHYFLAQSCGIIGKNIQSC